MADHELRFANYRHLHEEASAKKKSLASQSEVLTQLQSPLFTLHTSHGGFLPCAQQPYTVKFTTVHMINVPSFVIGVKYFHSLPSLFLSLLAACLPRPYKDI